MIHTELLSENKKKKKKKKEDITIDFAKASMSALFLELSQPVLMGMTKYLQPRPQQCALHSVPCLLTVGCSQSLNPGLFSGLLGCLSVWLGFTSLGPSALMGSNYLFRWETWR